MSISLTNEVVNYYNQKVQFMIGSQLESNISFIVIQNTVYFTRGGFSTTNLMAVQFWPVATQK